VTTASSPRRVAVAAGDDPDLAADLHPVADCPDLEAHLRALAQAERAEREVAELERQVSGRTGSLVRHFDRVLRLLEAWGHLDGWALTDSGEVLARTYHEADLLVAEALTTGLFDDLDAAEVASLASCLAYEHRGRDAPPPPSFPSTRVRARFRELDRLWAELAADEEAAGLPATRAPTRASRPSPTPGRPAGDWPRCSPARSSPAGTSSGPSSSCWTCSARSASSRPTERPGPRPDGRRRRCTAGWSPPRAWSRPPRPATQRQRPRCRCGRRAAAPEDAGAGPPG
jgi:hypothetical protein